MMREEGCEGSREVNPDVVFSLGKLGLWAVITHQVFVKISHVGHLHKFVCVS